jgi:hypothetical protein
MEAAIKQILLPGALERFCVYFAFIESKIINIGHSRGGVNFCGPVKCRVSVVVFLFSEFPNVLKFINVYISPHKIYGHVKTYVFVYNMQRK